MPQAKPIPDGFHTVTPSLVIRGAAQALDFYRKAFGAEETLRVPGPGGAVMHAEIRIGNSMLMVSDENPEFGTKSPQAIGGTPVTLCLYVPDCDKSFQRAVAAGATATMPPADMFWGDRFAQVADPFGHSWAIATHQKDMTPAEIGQAMAAAFGG